MVTFHASYIGDDYVPHDTTATEVVTVTLPGNLDEKFMSLPKPLEGAALVVIKEHERKVNGYFSAKAEKDRLEREVAEMRRKVDLFSYGESRDEETEQNEDEADSEGEGDEAEDDAADELDDAHADDPGARPFPTTAVDA